MKPAAAEIAPIASFAIEAGSVAPEIIALAIANGKPVDKATIFLFENR